MPRVNPDTCVHPYKRLTTPALRSGKRRLGFYHCERCHSDVQPFGKRYDTLRISPRVELHAGQRVTLSSDVPGGNRIRGTFYFADAQGTAHVLTGNGWRMVDPTRLRRSKT